MATTIAVSCPKCEHQIKAPPDLVGKKVRCKECRHVFEVKAPAAKTEARAAAKPAAKGEPAKAEKAAERKKDPRFDRDDNPYGVTDTEFLPRCPYCAKELETDTQVICLNCGYNMRTRERVKPRKTYDITPGDWFLWLLPGIICATVFFAMVGMIVFTWIMFARYRDATEGWESWVFGKALAIWETIIYIFIGFFTGKFAIKRLILNYRPPEKEKVK